MRTLLTALLVVLLNSVLFAQTNQPSISKQIKQEPSFEQHQQLEPENRIANFPLTQQKLRPKLTLQRALKLTENYIEKENIDISSFYLYQAKFIMYGSKENQQPAWFFWWVNENGGLGNYVEIVVSIDTESVSRLPSM